MIFAKRLFDTHTWEYGQLRKLSFIASLLLLTRHDMALIVLPALIYAFFVKREVKFWRAIKAGVLGMLPFIAWEVFSLIYYGFPFPNTAYAKLNSGIPQIEYWMQGVSYFFAAFTTDPAAIAMMSAVIVISAVKFASSGQTDRQTDRTIMPAVAVGVLLYCVYILRIGGDFMGGRFYCVPFIMSAVLLSRVRLDRHTISAALAVVVLFSITQPYSILKTSKKIPEPGWVTNYIADERGAYWGTNGLIFYGKDSGYKPHAWYQIGKTIENGSVLIIGNIGFIRDSAPLSAHFIDRLALSEPLLSRLPAIYNPNWRVGHLDRKIPAGYVETLDSGKNAIEDKRLAEYYDILRDIISGPIFSARRSSNHSQ
ncbi:hypothetical protein FACS1894216_14830 [Synergistales bacterium]|nr:hypothetical protein FACS1894216_14830 [Synergistales bacterium]